MWKLTTSNYSNSTSIIQPGFGTSGAAKQHEMIWLKRGLLASRSFPERKAKFDQKCQTYQKNLEKNMKILQCQKFPGVHHLYPPSSDHPHVPSFPRRSWCQWWGLQTDCLADGISWRQAMWATTAVEFESSGGKKREKLTQLNMQWQLILRLSDVIWVLQIRIVYNTHVNM